MKPIWATTGKNKLSDDPEEISVSTDRSKRIEYYNWLPQVVKFRTIFK